LVRTSYSFAPILIVPEGVTTFSCESAFSSAPGAIARDCIAAWSRLIVTCRCLPPYAEGTTEPGTVINCEWITFCA